MSETSELPKSRVQQEPDLFGGRLPLTINLRIKFLLTGLIFPACSVTSGLGGTSASLNAPWQSGTREPYVVLFLQSYGLACFLPFIILSAMALLAFICKPALMKSFWIRCGLYAGAIVSLQFFIALFLVTSVISPIAAVVVGPCLALLVWGCSEVIKRVKRFTISHLMIITSIVAILLAVGVATDWQAMGVLMLPVAWVFIAAPTLNVVTYMRLAFLAAKHETIHRQSITKISVASLAVVTWIGGFIFAWQQAIDRVLIEYQNLPTTDPNCFVASAAAFGDPRFVNAEPIDVGSGEVMLNEQMQRLKFLELALQSLLPNVHRVIRNRYNHIGPKLARRCKASQPIANVSYLLLKPLEWIAEIVRRFAGVSKNRVRQIYRS